jgi:PAS domain-containing protein
MYPRTRGRHLARRRRSQSVADLEELFHLLIENVRDYAIFILAPDGRALTWNAGVQRTLGYAEQDFIGLEFTRLFRPAEREAARREMEKAASTGRSDDEHAASVVSVPELKVPTTRASMSRSTPWFGLT